MADNPALPSTFDAGAVGLSPSKVPEVDAIARDPESMELAMALQSYWNEADNNRKSGLNPRDDKWRDNLNLYWNRIDFSKKAAWQAKETMPEVPQYVDRFAAAMKEALVATPEGFYTVTDPADQEGDVAQAVKRMTDVWLTKTGRNQVGQLVPFSAFFEEQMKLGALTALSNVVTWKNDIPGGRVAVETVDPRFVWLDHSYRDMYRIRRIEVDRHDLQRMLKETDRNGDSIWNIGELGNLVNSLTLYDMVYKSEMAGHGVMPLASRGPITLDEYIATVVDAQGKVIADRSLMVVANQKYLIRGPEKNPFWHGNDWLVYTPLIPTPLSVYGRTYMEDFGSVAKTFTELTNLILDAVYTVSLKAWAIVPGMLLNPEQVAEGISPNKLFLLEEGVRPEDFAKALDLGTLPPESIKAWEMMKNELTEAAGVNEIGIGQFAPKGRTSATEVNATQQSSSAIVRSIAQTIETRWLDPNLDLIWKTGLQHVKASDKQILAAAGDQMAGALLGRRRELIQRPFTFQARGISNTIFKANQLKSLLSILQIIGANQVFMQQFLQVISVEKFVKKLFELSGIDLSQFAASDREKMMQQIAAPLQQAQNAGPGKGPQKGGPTAQGGSGQMGPQMGDLARTMRIQR
jgi:hypothetical protein